MKKLIVASVCALALTLGGAMAQTQPAPTGSSEGNAGPDVSNHNTTTHTKHAKRTKRAKHHKKKTSGQTTGMSRSKGTSAPPSGETKQPGGY